MKIYGISDLHLSFEQTPDPEHWEDVVEYKPMSEVDKGWLFHARRIYENWLDTVKNDDVVLVPGDISWAMRLEQAKSDLDYLGLLPGSIVGVQGNHDYWWQSISRVRAVLPSNVNLLQNDHVIINDIAICGTRGWLCPNASNFREDDMKIYSRELIRLGNSLSSVKSPVKDIIVIMHYMPTNEKHEYSGFIEIFEKYNVKTVVYGHIHAKACRYRLPDEAWGIRFHLTSADFLQFTPHLIMDI